MLSNNDSAKKECIKSIPKEKHATHGISKMVARLYKSLPDIVKDKKEFITYLVEYFYENILDQDKIVEYFMFILRAIKLTEKNLFDIKSKILNTDEHIEIVKIDSYLLDGSAIIWFSDGKSIVFKMRALEDIERFNYIINWTNSKLPDKYKLSTSCLLNYKRYGFIENIANEIPQDLEEYYFNSGQLLALLYMMDCNKVEKKDIISLRNCPSILNCTNLFIVQEEIFNQEISSTDIAKKILDYSVYNIEFLSEDMSCLAKNYINLIKSGYKYRYNIISSNKSQLIKIINELFKGDHLILSHMIPKIYNFTENDLKQQLYFLDVRFVQFKYQDSNFKFLVGDTYDNLNKEELKEIAIKLGDYIIQKSIIGVENSLTTRSWITDVKLGNKLELSHKCNSISYGTCGIAIFLLYLGVVTQKAYFIAASIESMRKVIYAMNKKSIENHTLRESAEVTYTLLKIYMITKDEFIKSSVIKISSLAFSILSNSTDKLELEDMEAFTIILLAIYKEKLSDFNINRVFKIADLSYNKVLGFWKNEVCKNSLNYDVNGVVVIFSILLYIKKNAVIEHEIQQLLKIERSIGSKKQCRKKETYKKVLISRSILKEYGYNDGLIVQELNETIKYIIEKEFGNGTYYNRDIENIELVRYAASSLEDDVLINSCNSNLNRLVKEDLIENIKKQIKFEDRPLSFKYGTIGQGYRLIRIYNEDIVPQILFI
ncbi:DUF4135 domain-containing protein [Clostridium cellulovorans]|uniref:Lantibiotic biosynthesis protein dehydration domain-containing protein n=1 Tax=Clostridium cellulovorans (strain ATCC 35296 / DSM 3052 / OCM 3 / 743B) TaxID=573061 RepID=D9SNC0_CLOC7|nr:DUF4135 domain-containing protein [Clostridium cellulovorans]ADL53912.1 hypothetical protein Clocel_4251 [Clostridium cellulovorans 743B]